MSRIIAKLKVPMLALTLLMSPFVWAATSWKCPAFVAGKNTTITIGYEAAGDGFYRTVVNVDDAVVPLLGKGCYVSTKPGSRFTRCTHQLGELRIEVYPVSLSATGFDNFTQIIVWDNNHPQVIDLAKCTATDPQ